MDDNSLVVSGREIKFEIKNVDIYEVDYYYDNPRINYIISRNLPEQVTSQMIESALLELDSTRELIKDIKDNGGLTDEILVLNKLVIEGNTRLCCYRRIYDKTKDERWKSIRAKVIKESISQKEIFSLLSNYHIKGKTPWEPYEKAACIQKMVEQGYSIEEIARIIRSQKPKVEVMLKAYKVMRDKYLVRPDMNNIPQMESRDELNKYSYFEAFYSDKNLVKRVDDTPEFVDEFVSWVAEGRLPRAQCVRELNLILGNKKARKEFCGENAEDCFREAQETLNWQNPGKVDGFYKKIDQFHGFLREANSQKIKAEIQANPQKKQVLKNCLKVFEKFCKEIGVQL